MSNNPMPIIGLIVGVALLLFGRKLFWLFVAAIGFVTGVDVAPQIMSTPPALFVLLVALTLGVVGAILAIVLQKVAIALAGFISGGRLAIGLSAVLHLNHADYSQIVFLLGGVLGAILLLTVFDWVLILLTSVEGANLISQMIVLPHMDCTLLKILLIVVGLVAQTALLRRFGRSDA